MLCLFFFEVAVWLLAVAGVMLVAAEDDAVQNSEFPEVSVTGFPGFSSLSSVLCPVLIRFNPTIPLDSDVVSWLTDQTPTPAWCSGVVVDGGVDIACTWS